MAQRFNYCPQCESTYPVAVDYCSKDGAQLTLGVVFLPRLVRVMERGLMDLMLVRARCEQDSWTARGLEQVTKYWWRLLVRLDPAGLAGGVTS